VGEEYTAIPEFPATSSSYPGTDRAGGEQESCTRWIPSKMSITESIFTQTHTPRVFTSASLLKTQEITFKLRDIVVYSCLSFHSVDQSVTKALHHVCHS